MPVKILFAGGFFAEDKRIPLRIGRPIDRNRVGRARREDGEIKESLHAVPFAPLRRVERWDR